MQSTLAEHAASSYASVACAECHMPRRDDGHHDHAFHVSRDPALLRAALAVTGERTASGLDIVLATRNVGHAMPTGDLFRRLRVVVRAEGPGGGHLGEEEILLARRFDRRTGVPIQKEDLRVFGVRRLKVEGEWLTAAARIDVEVRYERVAQTKEVMDVRGKVQERGTVFDSVLLSELSLSDRGARGRSD
jgi:hypothetical protein